MNKLDHMHPHFEIRAHEGFLSLKLKAVCHFRRLNALLAGRVVTSTSRRNDSGRGQALATAQDPTVEIPSDEKLKESN